MLADWSVEAAPDSPRIAVPWDGWRNLRAGGLPELTELAEVRAWPELGPLLLAANTGELLSSKVDVFAVTAEEADPELRESWAAGELRCGLASYLDVLLRAPLNFAAAEAAARHIAASLRKMEVPAPLAAEVVVRPAWVHGAASWAWSLYSMGFGPSPAKARAAWAHAAGLVLNAAHQALGQAQTGKPGE